MNTSCGVNLKLSFNKSISINVAPALHLRRGPFQVHKLARWKKSFPVDLLVWQPGESEAAGVLIGAVLGANGLL